MIDKEIQRFLNRKSVKQMLGTHELTNSQHQRLSKLFQIYTCKSTEMMHTTICHFILNDLTNYLGRYKRLKGIPGTSKYAQLLRYGKKGAQLYKKQNASKVKHFKNRIDYWLGQGLSDDDAKLKVREIQKERNKKAVTLMTGTSDYTVRSIQYWLKKGFTEQEAKQKVRQIQTTNGVDYYIQKYGQLVGAQRYEDRIKQWQETLSSKSQEEKDLINLKKGWSIDGLLARGYSNETAISIYSQNCDRLKSYEKRYSAISQKLFFSLMANLKGTMYFAENMHEYYINKRPVDFFHKESRTVIEFYGDYWHRNPKYFAADSVIFKMKTIDKWKSDSDRERDILKYVNKVLVVWEDEYRNNPAKCVERILEEFERFKI